MSSDSRIPSWYILHVRLSPIHPHSSTRQSIYRSARSCWGYCHSRLVCHAFVSLPTTQSTPVLWQSTCMLQAHLKFQKIKSPPLLSRCIRAPGTTSPSSHNEDTSEYPECLVVIVPSNGTGVARLLCSRRHGSRTIRRSSDFVAAPQGFPPNDSISVVKILERPSGRCERVQDSWLVEHRFLNQWSYDVLGRYGYPDRSRGPSFAVDWNKIYEVATFFSLTGFLPEYQQSLAVPVDGSVDVSASTLSGDSKTFLDAFGRRSLGVLPVVRHQGRVEDVFRRGHLCDFWRFLPRGCWFLSGYPSQTGICM